MKESENSLNSSLLYSSDEEREDKDERRTRRVKVKCRNSSVNSLSEDTPKLTMETRKGQSWKGFRAYHLSYIPDTGASISVCSTRITKRIDLKINKEEGEQYSLTNASNQEMKIVGMSTVFVRHPQSQQVVKLKMLVSPDMGGDDILLGWKDLKAIGVIPEDFPNLVNVKRVMAETEEGNGKEMVMINRTKIDPKEEESEEEVEPETVHGEEEDEMNVWEMEEEEAEEEDDIMEEDEEFLEMKRRLTDEFPEVFADNLDGRSMKGNKIHLEFDQQVDVKPINVSSCRPIELNLRPAADQVTKKLLEDGTIIPQISPTEWCSPARFVEKGQEARLTVDFRRLNKALRRPVKPFTSASHIQQALAGSTRVLASLDMTSSYYQMDLHPDSQELTTFITPSGRYRFTKLPMGISPASDHLNLRTEELVVGHDGLHKNLDDVLVEATDMKELYLKLRELLQRAKKMGVTFSIKKFKIGTSLVYGGFLIKVDKEKGEISVLPDPKKIESMKNISPPTNRLELLSFLGLVKTFGKWSPHISFKTSHLKQLSTKGKVFNFDEVHLKEFLEIKAIISSPARL